jgi:hypothetical protein
MDFIYGECGECRGRYVHVIPQVSKMKAYIFNYKIHVHEIMLCMISRRSSFIYQAMTLTKDSVLWNGLPQSGNIASPTFGEKIQNPLNLSLDLHLSNMSVLILRQFKNALSHCNT